jgi:hypothetical protein
MYILQITQKSKYLYKPDDDNYHYHKVEDSSDFSIHGDVVVNKPEENPGDDKYKQDSE